MLSGTATQKNPEHVRQKSAVECKNWKTTGRLPGDQQNNTPTKTLPRKHREFHDNLFKGHILGSCYPCFSFSSTLALYDTYDLLGLRNLFLNILGAVWGLIWCINRGLSKNISHHGWSTPNWKKRHLLKRSEAVSQKTTFGPKNKWFKVSYLELFF